MKLTDGSYVYEGLGEKIVQILVESLAWRLQLDYRRQKSAKKWRLAVNVIDD